MTLGDLIFRTAHKSGLQDDDSDEHSLMLSWARDGVVRVLLETHCVVDTGDMSLAGGAYLYEMDPEILLVLMVRDMAGVRDLEPVAIEVIRARQRNASTGPLQLFSMEGSRLYVYPVSTAGTQVELDYVPRPQQQLTNSTDDPSLPQFGRIPSEYHNAIESYMTWKAAEYDDKKFAQTPEDLFKAFKLECRQTTLWKRGKRGRTPQRPLIGYPGSDNVPSRNDQDLVYG